MRTDGLPGEPLPEIREVTLLPSSALADGSIGEARIRERFGVMVVAVTRASGDFVLHPSAQTVLRPGDILRVFGLPAQIDAFVSATHAED